MWSTHTDIKEIVSLDINTATVKTDTSVNAIFSDHWDIYKEKHCFELRAVEVIEVERMLRCGNPRNGYMVHQCPDCGEQRIIHFNCNSRICSRCGKLHADEWARKLSKRLFKVNHRHVVMTLAEELRSFFEQDRSLLKVLMDSAIIAIEDTMGFWVTKRDHRKTAIMPGIVVVLHTYGRDLGFNSHIHIIMSEGGFNQREEWVNTPFIPYKALRKTWQYQLLTNLKRNIPDTKENRELIDRLFKEKNNGFYVRAKDRINSIEILRYIGRYIRHPAIANSRIVDYDGKTVTFWYERNEERFYKTMDVEDFMRAVIGHIPDRQFKLVRYYGAYSRRKRVAFAALLRGLLSITQSKLTDFEITGPKKLIKCPNCGCVMDLIECVRPPPPQKWPPVVEITRWL